MFSSILDVLVETPKKRYLGFFKIVSYIVSFCYITNNNNISVACNNNHLLLTLVCGLVRALTQVLGPVQFCCTCPF